MYLNLLHKIIFLYFLCIICTAESADPKAHLCSGKSNNAQVSTNIRNLLPKLVSGTITNGFISTSYGSGKGNQVFGLAQCRGDVSKNNCSTCIQDAANNVLNLCPNQTDARIWYDNCFLRYNTVNSFGKVDIGGFFLNNVYNVTNPRVLNQKLGDLMDAIDSQAVKPVNKGLGKGNTEIPPSDKLYGLVQCTRDLSSLNCAHCLSTAIGMSQKFFADKIGRQVLFSSCFVRYDLFPFFLPLDQQESLDPSYENYESVMVFEP